MSRHKRKEDADYHLTKCQKVLEAYLFENHKLK